MTEPTSPAPDGLAVIEGPATLAGVALWLDQGDDDEVTAASAVERRPQLPMVVSAVNVWVRRLHPGTGEPAAWAADVVLGASMLAGRLWRRRDTPAGVETFAGDGAVYVQRTDPDVAMLLQIGTYAPPRVG